MPYQDISLKCVQCGADFVFTADEQEYFEQRGLASQPKRCKSCRAERKKRPAQKRGGGIYRSPAFENSAPSHQRIRGGRRGADNGRGEYRSPAFRERDKVDPVAEYRSPAFRDQEGVIPEQEYRSPGFKEYADIKVEEEYRAPGFREYANIKVNEQYRSPAFRDIQRNYSEEKPLFAIVCSACGKDAMVPFIPEEREEHFCQECYAEKRRAEAAARNDAAEQARNSEEKTHSTEPEKKGWENQS